MGWCVGWDGEGWCDRMVCRERWRGAVWWVDGMVCRVGWRGWCGG